MRLPRSVLILTAALMALSGCAAADSRPEASPAGAPVEAATATALTPDGVQLPPVGVPFDYQLGGISPVPDGVGIVVRDSTEEPAGTGYDICYVNGFQTQPGIEWPEELLVRDADGGLLVDPNWPDEHLLDTSSAANREAIAARLSPAVDACADAGYRGLDIDNLDSWTRSGGALDQNDAVAFATLLVKHAHVRGLAVGQKNTADLGSRGRDEVGFDFAVTEECDLWNECGAYTNVYGARVLDIEYTDDLRGTVDEVCARMRELDPAPSAIVRDRNLVPASDPAYEYTAC